VRNKIYIANYSYSQMIALGNPVTADSKHAEVAEKLGVKALLV
jgi:hypothetical protein